MAALPEIDHEELAAADTQYRLGQVHLTRNAADDALDAFRSALSHNPGHNDAKFATAYLLNAMGGFDEAHDLLGELVAAMPDNADAFYQLGKSCQGKDDIAGAIDHFRRAIAIDADHFEAIRDLASVLTISGAFAEAEELLKRALENRPDDIESQFYFGNLLSESGRHQDALPYLETVHTLARTPATGNNYATALINTNQPRKARDVIEAVLSQQPDYGLGWFTKGATYTQEENPRQAVPCYRKALETGVAEDECKKQIASSLTALLQLREAVELYRDLEQRYPDDVEVVQGLGTALEALGLSSQALPYFERMIELQPNDAASWNNMALSLQQLGRFKESIEAAERALALAPTHTKAYLVAANSYIKLRQKDKALPYLTDALKHVGDDLERLFMIGELFEAIRLTEEASLIYKQIVDVDPNYPKATSRLLDASLSLCDWSRYDEFVNNLITTARREIETGKPFSFDVFNLQALPVSYAFMFEAAKSSAQSIAETERAFGEPYVHAARPRSAGDRIRLGYLLPYTNFHSLPLVLKEIVERHDRDRFEVIGFSTSKCDATKFSRGYRAAFDSFFDVPAALPVEAARQIHAHGIDVLIDVAGLTSQNCMDVLAHRPAPVQAHFLGYSITTGADYVDYLITDKIYIPPEWQRYCSEKVVYLPETFMATKRQDAEVVELERAHFDLPENGFVFANFNHPCKFEPRVFSAWMEILSAVPDSVLWFGAWTSATQRNLKSEAEKHRVDPDRLVFSDIVDRPVHLARLALADLALDNLYHGGGITTVDALWVGLPVLTISGKTPGARLGATLTAAADLPDMIVDDLDAYVRTAIALARDPASLAAIRDRLVGNRDTCPLFDLDRYRQGLEQAIEAMWLRFENGDRPDVIDIGR